MSDTNNAEADTATRIYVKSMKPSSLGAPRAPNVAGGELKVVLGVFLGEVSGCREYVTEDKAGNELVAYPLTGTFQGICADGRTIYSSTLYLPSGFHESIVDAVTEPEYITDAATGVQTPTGKRIYNGARVKIAYAVRTIPSTSKAGYSYELEAMEDINANRENPVDVLMNKHAAAMRKLLPEKAAALLPAPAPAETAKAAKSK